MSLDEQPEMTEKDAATREVNAANATGPSTPEAPVSPAVASFRRGFFTDAQYGLLMTLGEDPREYQRMMESMLEDLQPREGFEWQLVEQIFQTFWRMQRAQRMEDGLGLKRIQNWLDVEKMAALEKASKAIEALEPFERLSKALARRRQGPTAEEIDEFVKCCKGNSSEKMREFIDLLRSLKEPREERERKAALQKARAQLRPLMEPYESVAWHYARLAEKVDSSENLAALMVPNGPAAVHVQRMEDINLRRLWRLTNTFAKVRQGAFKNKKVDDRSQNVYENKQKADKMTGEMSDI